MTLFAAVNIWRWHPHPEVWALVVGLIGMYAYAIRVIGPTATQDDEVIVTKAQVRWFVAAMVTLEVAADWPMHDIGEKYLYSVHMAQHLLLSFVLPPMALLATPTWLARLVIGNGRGYRVVRWTTRVVPATIFFNVVVVFSHWPAVVALSVKYSWFHYSLHFLVVAVALNMWMGICSPLPELRFTLLVQAGYLFLQSVVPTVPAGILVFSETVAYKSYNHAGRILGMTPIEDQQLAATIMKVVAGTYLWVIIACLFIRFATRAQEDDRVRGVQLDRRAPAGAWPEPPSSRPVRYRRPSGPADEPTLTWDEVQQQLADAGPAPREPSG
ncbi:MAG TPA: cytochrome c oxidase assembly protein [Acidimicrobiales bacterium]|jgi:putative membrane protein